eukprot:scaffold80_cov131-Pinguiococcus_pyrenoidosus.AAC.1
MVRGARTPASDSAVKRSLSAVIISFSLISMLQSQMRRVTGARSGERIVLLVRKLKYFPIQ